MPAKTRLHIKVRTDLFLRYEDMARYLGYRGVPVTAEPIRTPWVGTRSGCLVHRFEEDGYTYLRQPSHVNTYWVYEMAVGRYASFGVKAEVVRR